MRKEAKDAVIFFNRYHVISEAIVQDFYFSFHTLLHEIRNTCIYC